MKFTVLTDRFCDVFKKKAFDRNEGYRANTKKSRIYWFDHFVVEGAVLYRLNKEYKATRRDGMFKVKPVDIELFHWEQFDSGVQMKVLEAVQSLYAKNLPINEENMKQEMEMSEIAFSQYKSDIMNLASGVPKLNERKEIDGPQVLILVGIPGRQNSQR